MGQILSNFIKCVFGGADEEERPNEQSLLISPPISDSSSNSSTHGMVFDSSIQIIMDAPPFTDLNTRQPRKEDQAKEEDNEEEDKLIISNEAVMKEGWIQQYNIQTVEDSMLVSVPFPHLNIREQIEEDNEASKRIVGKKMMMNHRWIRKCSSSQSVQVVEDSRQVSSPFPDLNKRKPREEDNVEEEEKLIISNEAVMKEGWIQYSSSHSIQAVEDNMQVSPPFPDLNTREDSKEKEEEKLTISKKLVMKQRWIPKCSSSQSVGVMEDSRQVSPRFPDLNTSEPREEDQAKEEDNEEEEKLIISNEVMMKQRWIRKCSRSHSNQAVEDSMLVSFPFPDLNTMEQKEENIAKEEAKLNISEKMVTKQRWIQKCSSSHSIQVEEDSRQVSPPFPDLNTREDSKAKEEEKLTISKKIVMKQRWIPKCSSSQSVGVMEDSRQVSPPFPDLNTSEPREEDQAKEEDNEEEEKLIISNEVMMKQRWIRSSHSNQAVEDSMLVSLPFPNLNTMEQKEENIAKEEAKLNISEKMVTKQRWIQKCSSSHSIQVEEDSRQVSSPFPDLNTREPREDNKAKEENNEEEEKLIISQEEDNEEGEKLITSEEVVMKERWIQHYSSSHKILLVGEGDFSFSASLAVALGSASNMVATSLDSEGFLCRNYKKAMSNVDKLRSSGCTVMHNVNATRMVNHGSLKGMAFDRIIFNFPLAGFFSNESRESQLRQNQTLILLFLENAKRMISEEGEIHIAHKSWGFFLQWDLEHLASVVGLQFMEELPFNLKDYKGYHTKYGFGGDRDFNCQPSKTYKFGLKAWEKDF